MGEKGIIIMGYVYVTKKEYQPVREELEEIIKEVQKRCKEINKEFTFQFKLVGSGKKHLITRLSNGNKGYDFDYNLILNIPSCWDEGTYWNPKYAKELLINEFRNALEDTKYSDPENSTSVFTIKYVDQNKKAIIHSCDFAVIYYPEEQKDYFKYVRLNKQINKYTWEVREESTKYTEKINWLKDNVEDYWGKIREEYLNLKNNNRDKNKRSFQLFLETVNNLFNRYVGGGIQVLRGMNPITWEPYKIK